MTEVDVFQSVHTEDHLGWGGGSHLFVKKFDLAFLPPEGAMFHISAGEDGDEDGVANYVKRVYWSHTGAANVELVDWQVDPSEQMQLHCNGDYRRAWWTNRDGDLMELLRSNGWNGYGS